MRPHLDPPLIGNVVDVQVECLNFKVHFENSKRLNGLENDGLQSVCAIARS